MLKAKADPLMAMVGFAAFVRDRGRGRQRQSCEFWVGVASVTCERYVWRYPGVMFGAFTGLAVTLAACNTHTAALELGGGNAYVAGGV